MPELALPTVVVHTAAAVADAPRPLLANRDPGPEERDVPLASAVALELVDVGPAGVSRSDTRVWVSGRLAFDGSAAPELAPLFAGPGSTVAETPDALRVVLRPLAPFGSLAKVDVRVVTKTKDGAAFDETYWFVAEDRTAPRLVAAEATGPRAVRLGFDEPIAAAAPQAIEISAVDAPAVPLRVASASPTGTTLTLTVTPEMSPDVRYRVRASGVVDLRGNETAPPFDQADFFGFRPPRPARRRFDLWSMLPKHNRRSDLTGDLRRFIACLQEVTDLLLAEVDRFTDVFDLERAPEAFVDLILRDLGNPFAFDLNGAAKRRLAAVLVEMYQQKGTAPGIRNAVRFFLGVDVVGITPLAATALTLGESLLGVDWELGPSDRFARYAFSVRVDRVLSPKERKHLRVLVEYLKPAHTHFVDLIEPLPPIVADHWEVGVSEVGETTLLH